VDPVLLAIGAIGFFYMWPNYRDSQEALATLSEKNDEKNYRRDINRGSATYWQNIDVSAEAITHPTTSGIMIRHSRGSKYGWYPKHIL